MPLPHRPVLFVRHGQTEYNLRHVRCGGDVDIALTCEGEAQAGAAGLWLKEQGLAIDAIVASPLIRTRRTAEIIHAALGTDCPLLNHAGLIERRLGAWNGLDIAQTQPWFDQALPPPGGETEPAFRARISETVADILARPYRLPLLVASKGVARVLGLLAGHGPQPPAGNAQILRFDMPR